MESSTESLTNRRAMVMTASGNVNAGIRAEFGSEIQAALAGHINGEREEDGVAVRRGAGSQKLEKG